MTLSKWVRFCPSPWMLKVCTVVLARLGCSCVLQAGLEGLPALSYREWCAGQIRVLEWLKAGSKYCPFLLTIVSLAAVQTQHPWTFPIHQVPEIKWGKCDFLLASLQQEQGPENDSWTLLKQVNHTFWGLFEAVGITTPLESLISSVFWELHLWRHCPCLLLTAWTGGCCLLCLLHTQEGAQWANGFSLPWNSSSLRSLARMAKEDTDLQQVLHVL